MTKKEIALAIALFIVVFSMLSLLVYILIDTDATTPLPNAGSNTLTVSQQGPVKADIPTEGNDTIYLTNTETRIRIINEYNKNLFTAKKNLLIMFGSWCPNCQEEIKEIENIINYYKDNKDIKILVIAHEFKELDYPLDGIISLLENDVNYGDFEVLVDFERIIRGTVDPSASTVPVSYVVDKNGKILEKHDESLTLKKAQEMLK